MYDVVITGHQRFFTFIFIPQPKADIEMVGECVPLSQPCPQHNSISNEDSDLKLGRQIDFNEEKCSGQYP